jgi:serine/threonine protein phosphatase PrpC
MASDGLWDEVNRKQAAEKVKGNDQSMKAIASK